LKFVRPLQKRLPMVMPTRVMMATDSEFNQ
jgi:hypothetical protein